MAPPKRVNIPLPPKLLPMTDIQGRVAMKAILQSQECQSINFVLGGAQINGALFSQVAAGLWGIDMRVPSQSWPGGRGVDATKYRPITTSYWVNFNVPIGLTISAAGSLMVEKGGYEPGTNTFKFPFSGSIGNDDFTNQGTIVHECVHAGLDAAQIKIKALDDEAAARVAQQWYRRAKMGNKYALESDVDMMFSIIATIAMNVPNKPYQVPDNFLQQMRAVLKARGYEKLNDTDMSPTDGVAPIGGLNMAVQDVK